MAAEYFKDESNSVFIRRTNRKHTSVRIDDRQECYRIEHYKWSNDVEIDCVYDIPSTAREFQEAYLRAKTALDEIVSAE